MPEHRTQRSQIPLADALMSGLAVFGLKYPSLLTFEEAYNEGGIRHNLHTLYGVGRAPCDTQLRTLLDPAHLRPAFRAVHRQLQRHKALEPYQSLEGYYLVSIDGTGPFASLARFAVRSAVPKQLRGRPTTTTNCSGRS